ncbi:MAG: fibronectin type III domain-containing protein [Paludibacteraceae bacterium]|nr:fibronectin type III domain-containing protein [Paludibacteraceae bacterium]
MDGQQKKRSYVAKATFTIVPSIPLPTSPNATSISSSSATINWTAAAGADSYEIRYGTTSGSLGAATNVGNVTSYALDELEDETTYYYQVRTKIGSDYSAWTDESSFTTLAASPFVYKGITFSKWNTATSMPTSGNYYLNTDVELSANASLTGDLNLCLNGHNLLTYAYKITVSGHTFALYDNEGTGVIRGAHQTAYSGLIYVEADGVFVIGEGSVQNIAEENSVAIYNLGSLKLSGAPTISGVTAGIQLASSKYITIESGKPLTNTTPYSVNSAAQNITSGWSNMGGANPSDYFTSAKSGYAGVCLNGNGEAQLVRVMSLDQEEDNASAISSSTYAGQLINVSLTRSLTSAQYNTFCLPFALTDAQLQSVFGSGYDLQELTGSSLTGDVLNLVFNKVTSLEAGKPYLLQPSVDVPNPVFEGVTITATSPGTSTTTYVDYKAVYSSTSLEGGNRNLLFLGAGNELFWPESTGNLNGFRAYFEIKDAAAQAAKRARISMGGKIATGNLSPTLPQGEGVKILRDGKLYLIDKGQMYDIQGKRI